MRNHSEEFLAQAAIYLENWPPALADLSVPQTGIPLTLAEGRALGSAIRHYGHWFGRPGDISGIEAKLGGVLEGFPTGAVVRLGSVSGKDSHFAASCGMRVYSSRGAIRLLTDGSRRLAESLRVALTFSYAPHVFVREWRAIAPWAEFRCFVSHRRLVGISQYDCGLGHSPEIASNAGAIRAAIEALAHQWQDLLPVEDVVADVFIEAEPPFRATLLELNPFSPRTSPCLFRWDWERDLGGDFDGSFRFQGDVM